MVIARSILKLDKPLIEGRVVKRVNRFVVLADTPEGKIKAHLAESGRLGELIYPGSRILLYPIQAPKTSHRVLAAYREPYGWVLTNSLLHRQIAQRILELRLVKLPWDYTDVLPEQKIPHGRIDFILKDNPNIYLEVKGCTLFEGTIGLFPDAPTERGRRHLQFLMGVQRAVLMFIVPSPTIKEVRFACDRDPKLCRLVTDKAADHIFMTGALISLSENGTIYFHGQIKAGGPYRPNPPKSATRS